MKQLVPYNYKDRLHGFKQTNNNLLLRLTNRPDKQQTWWYCWNGYAEQYPFSKLWCNPIRLDWIALEDTSFLSSLIGPRLIVKCKHTANPNYVTFKGEHTLKVNIWIDAPPGYDVRFGILETDAPVRSASILDARTANRVDLSGTLCMWAKNINKQLELLETFSYPNNPFYRYGILHPKSIATQAPITGDSNSPVFYYSTRHNKCILTHCASNRAIGGNYLSSPVLFDMASNNGASVVSIEDGFTYNLSDAPFMTNADVAI